jgi:hypothetical protein
MQVYTHLQLNIIFNKEQSSKEDTPANKTNQARLSRRTHHLHTQKKQDTLKEM